jgi:hypothetical protein
MACRAAYFLTFSVIRILSRLRRDLGAPGKCDSTSGLRINLGACFAKLASVQIGIGPHFLHCPVSIVRTDLECPLAGLQRVTHEVWQMKKLDLAKLQKAFAGK